MKNSKGFFVVILALGVIWNVLSKKSTPNYSNNQSSQVTSSEGTVVWPAVVEAGMNLFPLEKRTAKNYYLIFDGSGSMGDSKCSGTDSKINVAKRAVIEFTKRIPANVNLGLGVFDGDGLKERVPLGVENRKQFVDAIKNVSANGGTPLESAIRLGFNQLAHQAALQMGYGEYHLVIVTDGEADLGQDPTSLLNNLYGKTPILMHTIGFCIGDNHSLNQRGKVIYQSADSPEELSKGLSDVMAEAETFNLDDFKNLK